MYCHRRIWNRNLYTRIPKRRREYYWRRKKYYKGGRIKKSRGGSLNSFGQEYWPSLNASVWEVVRKYFHFKTDIIAGIDANIFPILCLTPVIIFINDYAKKSFNLEEVAMYIVFFLTGISWMVLGKSHSYIHTHINYVLWYFGFVQCCFYIILNRFGNYVHEKKGKKSD